jgi:hypothetical protein
MARMFSGNLLLAAASLFFALPQSFSQEKTRLPKQGFPASESQMFGLYNAPDRVDVGKSWDFYIEGEFLWWQAKEEGLEYALTQSNGTAPLPNIGGEFVHINFHYEPGFKLGLGWNTRFDNWSLYAEYTNLHLLQSGHRFAPTSGVLFPFWIGGENAVPGGNRAIKADARWRLRLDLLDGEIARKFYLGAKLLFKPFTGLRAAWIRQGFGTDYLLLLNGIGGPSISGASRSNSHSWAIGPRIGIDTNWMFTKDFRLFGNVAASLLFTHYKTHIKQTDLPNVNFNATAFDITDNSNQIRSNGEIAVGFGWGTYLDRMNAHLDLSAGYEFHIFWNQNMMRSLRDTIAVNQLEDNGNLFLQGLTLSARLDF